MMLRAFLLINRKRLITAAIASVALVMITHVWVSADSLSAIPGVFWHHFCGCPPEADDAATLLRSFSILSSFIGLTLGFNMIANTTNSNLALNTRRFLLTRPVSRLGLQIYPLLIAFAAIALFPIATWGLLLLWLKLVHAPTLGHLVALIKLVPNVASLGPHPTLESLVSAAQFGRVYLAAVSVGLLSYAFFDAARWFLISPRPWLRWFAAVSMFFVWAPNLLPRSWSIGPSIFLIAPHGAGLTYIPSTLGIMVHLASALLLLYLAQFTLREAEL
jgi:hypothetical protein